MNRRVKADHVSDLVRYISQRLTQHVRDAIELVDSEDEVRAIIIGTAAVALDQAAQAMAHPTAPHPIYKRLSSDDRVMAIGSVVMAALVRDLRPPSVQTASDIEAAMQEIKARIEVRREQ